MKSGRERGEIEKEREEIVGRDTVDPDLIETEMLASSLKSSRNKNDSDLMIAIP